MKKIVIYKSKYGSTACYASWLAEALNCQAVSAVNVKTLNLGDYDIIILGGALYLGNIGGKSILTDQWDALKNKHLIVFTVGLENTKNADWQQSIINRNFNDEQRQIIKFFHLKGSINYQKLNFLYKILMFLRKAEIKYKKDSARSEEEKEFLAVYGKSDDFVKKDELKPIEDYIAQIERS
ncbi:MAG: flavodoxin domain-containing protein [Endomicrobia bacterium]|nr:flavodoxin domain-containing protein [Endomicrobiia bacterium]MCL2506492.1 flavodoxin domain-containing protein [Endomicrobiia bacterium]